MKIKDVLSAGLCLLILVAVAILVLVILFFGVLFLNNMTTDSAEAVTVSTSETIVETFSQVETEPIPEPEDDYIFYDVPFDIDTQKEIINICAEYDISYEIILGMISVESSFRPEVVGDGGNSFGLMQIQPRWWSDTMEREGVINLLDPLQNIRCGCAIMRELKDTYGTDYRALQAYNTGKPYTNNGYADKVCRHIGEFVSITECITES